MYSTWFWVYEYANICSWYLRKNKRKAWNIIFVAVNTNIHKFTKSKIKQSRTKLAWSEIFSTKHKDNPFN